MTNFRRAAMAAVLLAGGAAQAQTTIITEEPAQPRTVVRERVQLTPVQRQTIYRTIVREHVAPAPPPAVAYRVGTRVPGSVTLYPVPETVVAEVPAVKRYKYMVVNGQAILVDPVTSEVVAEVGD
jgi:Protein of unknown function (DUF1236)